VAMGLRPCLCGSVTADRLDEVVGPYRSAMAVDLPPTIATTYLLTDAADTMAIATVWRDRADLDAMVASGEEPVARRLTREAGGEPRAEFFSVIATSREAASSDGMAPRRCWGLAAMDGPSQSPSTPRTRGHGTTSSPRPCPSSPRSNSTTETAH